MKKLLHLSCLLVFCGCTSLQNTTIKNPNTKAVVAKITAKDATFFALREHPEWRPGFDRALVELDAMANAEAIDLRVVRGIIERLPVKELKTDTARIIVSDVQIIIEEITPSGGVLVTPENYANTRLIVAAIRDGVRMGIEL